jgi:hypothetical protein
MTEPNFVNPNIFKYPIIQSTLLGKTTLSTLKRPLRIKLLRIEVSPYSQVSYTVTILAKFASKKAFQNINK